jgi:hypothetical protein
MNQVWGRAESRGWPSSRPLYTITALVIGLASVFVIGYYRYIKVWTPFERLYLAPYLRSGLVARLGAKAGRYQLLINRKGGRLALDDEVVPVRTVCRGEHVRPDQRGREGGRSATGMGARVLPERGAACLSRPVDLSRPDAHGSSDVVVMGRVKACSCWA